VEPPTRAVPASKTWPRRLSRAQRLRLALWLKRARRQMRHKKPELALQSLARAYKLSDARIVHLLLSRAHEQAGDTAAAIKHMKLAIERAQRRNRPWLVDHLGVLLIKAGQKAEGCAAFRRALKMKRRLPLAQKHLRKFCR
jgi:tetratricopeptide (TPR) repeat protein